MFFDAKKNFAHCLPKLQNFREIDFFNKNILVSRINETRIVISQLQHCESIIKKWF